MMNSHVLRGPADADHFRTKVGRYGERWYADPLPACPLGETTDAVWPSVSTIKKASGNDWTFTGLKRVSKAIYNSPTLSTELNGMSEEDRYDRLKQINKSGLRDAAARGTNVHHMMERGLRGDEQLTDPMDGKAGAEYETAVRAFLDCYKPELVAAELVCINRDMNAHLCDLSTRSEFTGGYGGTADAIVKIDGKTLLVDWKSRGIDSDHGSYAEEAAQLAAYASADYYIAAVNGNPERVIVQPLDGGIIVSVKPDGCRVYPIDLDLAVKHWTALHAWWVARLTERNALGKPWAPRSVPATKLESLIAYAVDVDTLNAIWALHSHEWQSHHTKLAAARKNALIGNR